MAVGFHRTEKISRIGISETWHVWYRYFPTVVYLQDVSTNLPYNLIQVPVLLNWQVCHIFKFSKHTVHVTM